MNVSCAGSSRDDGRPTGKHLNGVAYQTYVGPEDIDIEKLNAVFEVVDSYESQRVSGALNAVLEESRKYSWESDGSEFVTGAEGQELLVGIRYKRGPLQFVFYENQILVAFRNSAEDAPVDIFLYVEDGDSLKVTGEYIL